MFAVNLKFIVNGTAELVMHPSRFKILKRLQESDKAQFVEQLAKATEIHPRLVSHHLDVLEEEGLVDCTYDLANAKGSTRRVAVRLCKVTKKAKDVFRDIEETLGRKQE